MDNDFDGLEPVTVEVGADLTKFRKEFSSAATLGRQFSSSLVRAFDGIAVKGKGVGDVLKSLALDLSKLVLKAAFKPLEQGIGSLFQGLLSGGAGFGGGAPALPVPFAKGGVISSPMTFPLGRGGVGLAGEAGPEAIMPLRRGADGRLGVAGGGGGGVVVTMNITTPDVDGFRQSETQVAAQLARAVSRGQRNL